MMIRPINCNDYYHNRNTLRNTSRASEMTFGVVKRPLAAVVVEDFKIETAKKLFNSIHKYFKLIEQGGSINDAKILSEELEFYNKSYSEKFTVNVDTLMSIKRDSEKGTLMLYQQSPNNKKRCVLFAKFDKHGQMVEGNYSLANMHFERTNTNLRRMKYGEITLLPYGDNDREWGITAEVLPVLHRYGDNSIRGMYDLFIEMARLYTTMYM